MSTLTLRPEASDVGRVRKFGVLPALLIISEGNRIFRAGTGSFCWSFRPPSAKPILRDPVLDAPTLGRDENLDCGLGDTELDDSSRSVEKSDITSAG